MGLHPPRNVLSLCAGGGGLDMGLSLAEPETQTVCWVEWEDYAQRAIVAGQGAGYFEPAPVWNDVFTFDGTHWRGIVDTILAGYPCQPFSAAGSRKGDTDERHLEPDIVRIVQEVRPRWLFLENVEGHLSLGLDTVLSDLRRLGFKVASGLFTAAETGASHKRARVFIVAYCAGNNGTVHAGRRGEGCGTSEPSRPCRDLADADGRHAIAERQLSGGEQRQQPQNDGVGGDNLVDASRSQRSRGAGGRFDGKRRQATGFGPRDRTLEDAGRSERRQGEPTGDVIDGQNAGWLQEASGSGESGEVNLGHPGGTRLEGREQPAPHRDSYRQGPHEPAAEPSRSWLPIAPPGPSDAEGWSSVLSMAPDLAPSISLGDIKRVCDDTAALVAQGDMEEAEAESLVCGMATGLAERTRSLRLYGNGVHPLTAALAWRSLSYALGLRPVDLGAACGAAGDPTEHVWLGAAE